jgi:FtsH-binding integral membrane protein
MDPVNLALMLSLYPVAAVLVLWMVLRKKKGSKKSTWFLLGFLAMAMFYIFAPDPSVLLKLYTEQGDISVPFYFASISAIFLFLAVYVFKRHEEDA